MWGLLEMFHLLGGLSEAPVPNFRWGDTFHLAFLFAVPPAGPDDGGAILASGPDWSITYNYGTGVVTATRGTSTLLGAVDTTAHCIHLVVWSHDDGADTAELYLDDPATPVATDSSAGFATLKGGSLFIGATGAHSILMGEVRLKQGLYDPLDGADWAEPVGCCFTDCYTTVQVGEGVSATWTERHDYTGSPITWPVPDRSVSGTVRITAVGAGGGDARVDPVAGRPAAGGSVGGLVGDHGDVFTFYIGERGHDGVLEGGDGLGGDSSGGPAVGGDAGSSNGAGGGGGTEVDKNGTPVLWAGGGGGGARKTILTPGYHAGAGAVGVGSGGNGEPLTFSSPFTAQGGLGGTLLAPGAGGVDGSGSPSGQPGSGHAGGSGGAGGGGGGFFGGGGGGGGGNEAGTGGGGSSYADTGEVSSVGSSSASNANGRVDITYTLPALYLTGDPTAPATYPQNAYVPAGLPGTIVGISEFELDLTTLGLTTAQSLRVACATTDLSTDIDGTWSIPTTSTGVVISGLTYRAITNFTGDSRIRFEFTTPVPIDEFIVIIDTLSGTVTVNEWSLGWGPDSAGWSVGFLKF